MTGVGIRRLGCSNHGFDLENSQRNGRVGGFVENERRPASAECRLLCADVHSFLQRRDHLFDRCTTALDKEGSGSAYADPPYESGKVTRRRK